MPDWQWLRVECQQCKVDGDCPWLIGFPSRGALTSPCTTWVVAFLVMAGCFCTDGSLYERAWASFNIIFSVMDLTLPFAAVFVLFSFQSSWISSHSESRSTRANFEISTSSAWLFFEFQSRASERGILLGMSPSPCRELYGQSTSIIKTPGRLFGPLGEILEILARHETWNMAF